MFLVRLLFTTLAALHEYHMSLEHSILLMEMLGQFLLIGILDLLIIRQI